MTPDKEYAEILDAIACEGLLRTIPDIEICGTKVIYRGREYLNLSSNDYLGIAASDLHRDFMAAAADSGEFLLGSPSSRLITGNGKYYKRLEESIASLYPGRAALVLGSGYLLNSGLLPAVTSAEDVILADKFVHASIIDGLKTGPAGWHRFAHNDLNHLEHLIKKHRPGCRNLYIATESLFSMDGDYAPLKGIVDLKEKHGCKIYLDEAHAFGACGPGGLGIAMQEGLAERCDIIIATLGKAIASQGAFAVTSPVMRELLVNRMRTLIFSTALPPLSLMWSEHVISLLGEMEPLRMRLRELTEIMGGESHIIPIPAGENRRAMKMSEKLRDEGFWVTPIRYPTVPKGSARIRVSLSAALPVEQIIRFSEICKSLKDTYAGL